jgi:aspartate/methionine/tyrosine aminotransferase
MFKRSLDKEKEILVTQGANQGIAVAMQAFIEEGDEVVLIEPFFDIYKPSIEVAGGKVVAVPLRLNKPFEGVISANDWKLDFEELKSKITPRTKAILINNPHNPTGKLYALEEFQKIADIAIKNNLLVFSDDVVRRGTIYRFDL